MDTDCSNNSFVTASQSDWTEVRETQFLDSEEFHKSCKIIDSSMLTIGKMIGQGAQATIFEGLWHNVASGGCGQLSPDAKGAAIKVAVKRFRSHTARRQWPDEILKLKGGNLCRLHGYVNLSNDDSSTSNSLVMDRYECDLRSLIDKKKNTDNRSKPFPAETDLSLIVQIALDLRCLHAHHIAHRDLKSSNILVVDSASNKVEIVIADFESSSNVVGTGFWRAPEVLRALRGEQQRAYSRNIKMTDVFSLKSDIYSFGMTCYEILTGKSPLEDLGASEYKPVLSGRRPDLPGDLNPKLCDLLRKCWHAAPEKRPTACEIILELRHVVEEMHLPPIQELVTSCVPEDELLHPDVQKLHTTLPPPTVSLFVGKLKQYVQHYGWNCFLSYHFMSPEEAVKVLKMLDIIEDRRCETWRKLPEATIVRERCRNMNSIFVTNAAIAKEGDSGSFEEYEKYVRELHLRWGEGNAIADFKTAPAALVGCPQGQPTSAAARAHKCSEFHCFRFT